MRVYAVMQKEMLCDEIFSAFAPGMTHGIFLCKKNAEKCLKRIRDKKDDLGLTHRWSVVKLDVETDMKQYDI